MYISVANICEMIATQQQVDVIQTVLNVKKSQSSFVKSVVSNIYLFVTSADERT